MHKLDKQGLSFSKLEVYKRQDNKRCMYIFKNLSNLQTQKGNPFTSWQQLLKALLQIGTMQLSQQKLKYESKKNPLISIFIRKLIKGNQRVLSYAIQKAIRFIKIVKVVKFKPKAKPIINYSAQYQVYNEQNIYMQNLQYSLAQRSDFWNNQKFYGQSNTNDSFNKQQKTQQTNMLNIKNFHHNLNDYHLNEMRYLLYQIQPPCNLVKLNTQYMINNSALVKQTKDLQPTSSKDKY
ncbi:hypothetical protein ABPG72_007857 [Tetrahymena utriculariae]